MLELVKNFTIEGGKILDPFCGSGTTGMACRILGRSFFGIEIEKKYVQLARKRIAEAEPIEEEDEE